jgi:hypothetical protein
MGLFVRVLICISFAGFLLYKYIDRMNELTEVRLSIPILTREVKEVREKIVELQYSIDTYESPLHLMELSRQPEFGFLKYPTLDEVIQLQEKTLDCPDGFADE